MCAALSHQGFGNLLRQQYKIKTPNKTKALPLQFAILIKMMKRANMETIYNPVFPYPIRKVGRDGWGLVLICLICIHRIRISHLDTIGIWD